MNRILFENVTPIYTGGNIYIYLGKIKNGSFFIACDCNDTIREIDTDPLKADFMEEIGQEEWEQAHLVKDWNNETAETTRFFISMLSWIIRHKPQTQDCNYQLYDMEKLKRYYERTLKGDF